MIRALLLALFATQAQGAETVVPPDDTTWTAIGRVNIGGYNTRQICSGALVAPDLVLTAAHCVARFYDQPDRAGEVVFVAGWNRGSHAAAATRARLIFGPGYAPVQVSRDAIGQDIALIRLSAALSIPPLATAALPPPGTRLAFAGYSGSRPHALAVTDACNSNDAGDNVVYLTCPAEGGNSGAPVLTGLPDAPRIVAVVSARGASGAYGAVLPDWVLAEIAR